MTSTDPKSVVLEFIRLAFGEKKVKEAFEKYAKPTYIQHNPDIWDGASVASGYLEGFFKAYPQLKAETKHVLAEGDKVAVWTLAQLSPADRPLVFVDLFRLEDGKIAEHWDVMQKFPDNPVNPRPMM